MKTGGQLRRQKKRHQTDKCPTNRRHDLSLKIINTMFLKNEETTLFSSMDQHWKFFCVTNAKAKNGNQRKAKQIADPPNENHDHTIQAGSPVPANCIFHSTSHSFCYSHAAGKYCHIYVAACCLCLQLNSEKAFAKREDGMSRLAWMRLVALTLRVVRADANSRLINP